MRKTCIRVEDKEETTPNIKNLREMVDVAISHAHEIRYKETKTRKPLPQRLMMPFHFLEVQLDEIKRMVIGMEAIEEEKNMVHLNKNDLSSYISKQVKEMVEQDKELSQFLKLRRTEAKKKTKLNKS